MTTPNHSPPYRNVMPASFHRFVRSNADVILITTTVLFEQMSSMLAVTVLPLHILETSAVHNTTSNSETSVLLEDVGDFPIVQSATTITFRPELLSPQELCGLIIAAKGAVQTVTSLCVTASLTGWMGYNNVLIGGVLVMSISCELFAIGASVPVFILARSMQGLSSSMINASALSILADRYRDDCRKRDTVMGLAMCAMCFGYAAGPAVAGFLYTFGKKALPYHTSAILLLVLTVCLCLHASTNNKQPSMATEEKLSKAQPSSTNHCADVCTTAQLLVDPYILLCLVNIVISCLPVAALEAVLTFYIEEKIPDTTDATVGFVWLPCSVSMLLATYICTCVMRNYAHAHVTLVQTVLLIICLACIALALHQSSLLALSACLCALMFAEVQAETAVVPWIGDLIDQRFSAEFRSKSYGSGYALWDTAYSFVDTIGPFFGAITVQRLGFGRFMLLMAIVTGAMLPVNSRFRYRPEFARVHENVV